MPDEVQKRAIVKSWIADAVVKHIINNDKFKMEEDYVKILTEVMNDFHLKQVEDEEEEIKRIKVYIKRGQQLGLPNEMFYEVPWDASDKMLLDIQIWWEGRN